MGLIVIGSMGWTYAPVHANGPRAEVVDEDDGGWMVHDPMLNHVYGQASDLHYEPWFGGG